MERAREAIDKAETEPREDPKGSWTDVLTSSAEFLGRTGACWRGSAVELRAVEVVVEQVEDGRRDVVEVGVVDATSGSSTMSVALSKLCMPFRGPTPNTSSGP